MEDDRARAGRRVSQPAESVAWTVKIDCHITEYQIAIAPQTALQVAMTQDVDEEISRQIRDNISLRMQKISYDAINGNRESRMKKIDGSGDFCTDEIPARRSAFCSYLRSFAKWKMGIIQIESMLCSSHEYGDAEKVVYELLCWLGIDGHYITDDADDAKGRRVTIHYYFPLDLQEAMNLVLGLPDLAKKILAEIDKEIPF